MDPWNKESLNLIVGDGIIWQGDEFSMPDGTVIFFPGMKDQVISLHKGARLDVIAGASVPALEHRFD